jgi:hypothetical protein
VILVRGEPMQIREYDEKQPSQSFSYKRWFCAAIIRRDPPRLIAINMI